MTKLVDDLKDKPRNMQKIGMIHELYELQRMFEEDEENEYIADLVCRARLSIKMFIWIHDALIDADLMEYLMNHLHQNDPELYETFWTVHDILADDNRKCPKIVDNDSGLRAVS